MSAISYKQAEQLANSGRLDEAQAMCTQLLAATPNDYLILYLSGAVYLIRRDYEKCREICNKLLAIRQDNADAFNMMAAVTADWDMDFAATEQWLQKALACNPNHTKALVNLGNLALQKWDLEKATGYYQRALTLTNNKEAAAYNGLAGVEAVRNNTEKSIKYYELALDCAPGDRQIISNLMGALYTGRRREDAIELALKVAQYEPHGLEALCAFSCFRAHALWVEAEPLLQVVLQELCNRVNSFRLYMISNLNMLGVYEASNQQLFEIHRHSGESIEKMRIQPPFSDHPAAFMATKRIRLAYLSADLKNHVVTHFFKELVNCRNRGRFELFLYSVLPEEDEDEVTALYRQYADHFIPVFNLTELQLAERIRADGIHILVDMGGYTSDNRLVALSYKPAPVQISYLGYPYTYGLRQMDYHISDPWLDGPNNAGFCVEKPLRMPQSFITIGEMFEQEINPEPPVMRNGYVTFGSLNNAYKLNPQTVARMSEVLLRTPNSRMILNHPNYYMPATQQSVIETFARHGVSEDRITIIHAKHPSDSHLRYYNDIDIMLDAMPLTGGTTTIDALWMGVPVITKVGEAYPQRLSYSIIKNTGLDLDDCIAFTEDEYVNLAVALAAQPDRIARLRAEIPTAMKQGILCDPIRFTAQFEALLIEAWNRKFPDTPIESLLGEDKCEIAIGDSRMVIRDSAGDQHAYALREQGDWYEPEAAFLAKNAHLWRCFWDYADDPGVFSIPFASQQKPPEETIAIRRSGLSSILIKDSIERFGLGSLQVCPVAPGNGQLPDLIRFSIDCNDGTGQLIAHEERAMENGPVILASLRSPAGEDSSAYRLLKDKGYMPFRLLPGYDLLIAVSEGEKLDSSCVNLFFCQDGNANLLEQKGTLARNAEDIAEMPAASDAHWVKRLQGLTYAKELLDTWKAAPPSGQWGDMYMLALNLESIGSDNSRAPAQRWACLNMAHTIMALLIQGEATPARLMTAIRIAAGIGLRTTAAMWVQALAGGIQDLEEIILDEPFLMPLAEWDNQSLPPDHSSWIKAAMQVVFERLRNFSSWYSLDASKAFWQQFVGHALFGMEAKRMLELIEDRIKASKPATPNEQ